MNDRELLRYARHIMLPEVDVAGQNRLRNSTVLLCGLGGLGSASSIYLAASGVGHLILVDDDTIELSNLQRQILYHEDDIGQKKTATAQQKLGEQNPNIKITAAKIRMLEKYLQQADIVLDGTDNFKSRFEINRLCVTFKKPLVSASVIRFEGQLAVFKGYEKSQPCYQCLYPSGDEAEENCADQGVFAPAAGLMGVFQALETLKILLKIGESSVGKLWRVDALNLNFQSIKIPKDAECPYCSNFQK